MGEVDRENDLRPSPPPPEPEPEPTHPVVAAVLERAAQRPELGSADPATETADEQEVSPRLPSAEIARLRVALAARDRKIATLTAAADTARADAAAVRAKLAAGHKRDLALAEARNALAERDARIADLEGALEDAVQASLAPRPDAAELAAAVGDAVQASVESAPPAADEALLANRVVVLRRQLEVAHAALRLERQARARGHAVLSQALREAVDASRREQRTKTHSALQWDAWIELYDETGSGRALSAPPQPPPPKSQLAELEHRTERLQKLVAKRDKTIQRLRARLDADAPTVLRKRVAALERQLRAAAARFQAHDAAADKARAAAARKDAYIATLERKLMALYSATKRAMSGSAEADLPSPPSAADITSDSLYVSMDTPRHVSSPEPLTDSGLPDHPAPRALWKL
ncbi:uncharacterized protein AMSG_01780 [Thecamonas trahens ATCC 50062]|uniref:Uncharacterized protein n=1 Tax=Thecamonas trahens ATCC 50062 TaxID=461836 RepID=A0A0L0DTB5_THETB|nr:hypothetical protein AMSG_01780 [Thecamonas trahens ATCC 50062]KNC55515.1 hypothetical protein AMSG_01780 [Thecamonas trahens ATCC 50062]|eukprot:XP_013761293.1 hypothetical protein AMSG_01780 [Thecamonas trahens ATCC 50062]